MTVTIGLVANVYNEANALPGWLETHTPFFDHISVMHAGPQGRYSDDGTIEILKKWHITTDFCAIDDGFGVVRTLAIHESPCDYVMILDADERFHPVHRVLRCEGDATPQGEVDRILNTYHFRDGNKPDWGLIGELGSGLRVDVGFSYNQGERLREILTDERPDVLCSIRRHWHDLAMRRPTQNWHRDPDWQARIVRNDPDIYFDPNTRMHERLVGAQVVSRADMQRGPFMDHFHFHFKRMEQAQRAEDVLIYDALHEGRTPPVKGVV